MIHAIILPEVAIVLSQFRTDRSTDGQTYAYRNTAAAQLQRGKNWLTLTLHSKPLANMKIDIQDPTVRLQSIDQIS